MPKRHSPNTLVPREEYREFPRTAETDSERLLRWLGSTTIRPTSAIRWDWERNYRLPARVVSDDLWLAVERGRGWCLIGETSERVSFKRGDIVSVPAGTLHEFTAETETRFASIHFRALVYGAVSLLDLAGFPYVMPRDPDGLLASTSLRLAREHVFAPPGRMQVMECGLRWMLLHAARECCAAFRPRRAMDHEGLPRVLPALERIAEGADDPELSVGELARRVHLSEQQFRKVFRRVTGVRPVEFIQTRRVELAARLLRSTDLAVDEIARRAGFSDAPYFHRVFKSRMMTTPREYRLRHEP